MGQYSNHFPRPTPRAVNRFRPSVELLDDRLVPSVGSVMTSPLTSAAADPNDLFASLVIGTDVPPDAVPADDPTAAVPAPATPAPATPAPAVTPPTPAAAPATPAPAPAASSSATGDVTGLVSVSRGPLRFSKAGAAPRRPSR